MTRRNFTSKRPLVGAFSSLALLALASTASAQPTPPSPMSSDNGVAPGFVTIDRGDETSFADVGLATSFFEGDDPDFNMRLDLYGQYVSPGGTGGYAALPISYLSFDDESETAIGNIEFGGLHNLQLNPNTTLVLRGGLSLATADDDIEGIVTNFANAFSRVTDYIAIFPETTALRLAASPVFQSGQVFLRADGGFDIAISSPDGSDVDPLVRLNLGAGVKLGTAALMFELATLGTTGDVNDGEDRFLHTAAFSGRFDLGGAQAFAALVLPINVDGAFLEVDMTLMAGARIPIGQ